MKKLNVLALFLGLSLALVTTSAFRTTGTLHAKEGTAWVPISNLTEGDPLDLQPGEYACVEVEESQCTAIMTSPSDPNPQNIRTGEFVRGPEAE